MSEPNSTTVQTDQGVVEVRILPPEPDAEAYSDYAQVAAMFFVAAISIYLLRRLIALFSTDTND